MKLTTVYECSVIELAKNPVIARVFKDCPTDGLENATWLAERIVNIPSSVIMFENHE